MYCSCIVVARIVNERVYFDAASLLTQIGRGDLLALIAGGQQ
jgi:hypothetical protein